MWMDSLAAFSDSTCPSGPSVPRYLVFEPVLALPAAMLIETLVHRFWLPSYDVAAELVSLDLVECEWPSTEPLVDVFSAVILPFSVEAVAHPHTSPAKSFASHCSHSFAFPLCVEQY